MGSAKASIVFLALEISQIPHGSSWALAGVGLPLSAPQRLWESARSVGCSRAHGKRCSRSRHRSSPTVPSTSQTCVICHPTCGGRMQLLGASSVSLWYSVASQCLRASKHLLFSFLNQSDIQRRGSPVAPHRTGETAAWSELSLLRAPQKMRTNPRFQRVAAPQTPALAPHTTGGCIRLRRGVSMPVPTR